MLKRRLLVVILAAVMTLAVMSSGVAAAPDIAGQIAIVIDFETGEVLYERRSQDRWIPASMTKSLTAFITYQEIERGNMTMETMVPISGFASRIAAGGYNVQGNHVTMREGSYVSVEELLRLNMLPSSNGASVALAEFISGSEAAFAEKMNATANELMLYADFRNSHGALVHYTTADSVASLTREFIYRYPDILRITSQPFMYFEGTRQNNTNLLVRPDSAFYRASVDGFKTGVIREAGWGHSVTEYRDGRRIIAVVMNSTNNDSRHRDALSLLDFGFEEAARRDEYRRINRPVNVNLDGEYIYFDVPPRIVQGRVMVPARTIFEALGASVEWARSEYAQTVTAEMANGDSMALTIGSRTVLINGTPFETDVAALLVNSRTLVPLRFIMEATSAVIEWDGDARTVIITTSEYDTAEYDVE